MAQSAVTYLKSTIENEGRTPSKGGDGIPFPGMPPPQYLMKGAFAGNKVRIT